MATKTQNGTRTDELTLTLSADEAQFLVLVLRQVTLQEAMAKMLAASVQTKLEQQLG